MKKAVLIISSVFLFSCGTTSKVSGPTQADATRGAKMYPELTLEELNHGRVQFESKCTQCHGAKDPKKHSPEEWRSVISEMAVKADRKGKEKIDEATQESIQKYLAVMSGK